MFGLGFWEFVVIVLVIIIFVRPADLPKFLYRVGRLWGKLSSYYYSLRRQMEEVRYQVEREIKKADSAQKSSEDIPTPFTVKPVPPQAVREKKNEPPQEDGE